MSISILSCWVLSNTNRLFRLYTAAHTGNESGHRISFIIRDGSSSQVLQHDQQQAALKDFRTLADKAISLILCLCLPMATGIIFMSKPIIKLFCDRHFTPSILTLQLIAPTIFFIGLSGHLGYANPLSTGEGKAWSL